MNGLNQNHINFKPVFFRKINRQIAVENISEIAENLVSNATAVAKFNSKKLLQVGFDKYCHSEKTEKRNASDSAESSVASCPCPKKVGSQAMKTNVAKPAFRPQSCFAQKNKNHKRTPDSTIMTIRALNRIVCHETLLPYIYFPP